MRLGLDAGIYQFNVEGEPELEVLNEVALSGNAKAPVTIRVNPDVDAKTHAKITTGTYETKFGVPWSRARSAYALAAKLPGLEIVGVDVHIGSQITELAPFKAAFQRVADLITVSESRRPPNHAGGFGRGLGRALSSGQHAAAGSRRLWRNYHIGYQRPGCAAHLRARPPDRRECRHPGLPRALRETGRSQDFPGT